jgi:hypothetical protein
MPLRKSPLEIALRETTHIVILCLDGLEIANVVEQHSPHADALRERLNR